MSDVDAEEQSESAGRRVVAAQHTSPLDFAGPSEQSTAELGKLRNRLAFSEQIIERLEADSATASDQNTRLSALLIEQADQLAAVQKRLYEVAGLCDLADWAAATTGPTERTTVLVEDLRRVLST